MIALFLRRIFLGFLLGFLPTIGIADVASMVNPKSIIGLPSPAVNAEVNTALPSSSTSQLSLMSSPLSSAATFSLPVTPGAPTLTLIDAIMLSLRYNPSIKTAEVQRIMDKFNLRLAHYNYEVQYALTGTLNYTNGKNGGVKNENDSENITPSASLLTPLGTQLSASFSNPYVHIAGQPRFYNPALTFNLTQPLLQGFGPDVTLAPWYTALDQEHLNKLTLKNTVISTVTQVINQYIAVVNDQNTIKTNQISLSSSIATLKNYQALEKVGRFAPADLVQFQANVASQQVSLQAAQIQWIQDKYNLLILLGLDPKTPINIANTVNFGDRKIPPLQKAIDDSLLDNIAYQQQLIAIRIDERNLMLAKNQQLWQLNLTASRVQGQGVGGRPNMGFHSMFNGKNYNTTVGLQLTVPLNDVTLQSQLVNAKAQLEQERITLEATKRQTITNVTNAYYQLEVQQQQIEQSKEAVDLANRSLGVAEAKLKYGRSTPFEVTNLLNTLTSQQLTYLNAESSFLTNLANFDQTIGTTLDRWGICIRY